MAMPLVLAKDKVLLGNLLINFQKHLLTVYPSLVSGGALLQFHQDY